MNGVFKIALKSLSQNERKGKLMFLLIYNIMDICNAPASKAV